ncbi:MAG: cell division protein FtsQ [Thermosediminibacterales bacterium]|nr:cell division protein FtsQ [Thermosediminibacterales bacterium]
MFVFSVGIIVLTSDIFGIKQIQVEGNTYLSKEDIILESGISYGQNVLKINPEVCEKKIEKNPWIQSAIVHREFPDKILIQVIEKEEAAAVKYMGSFVLIDISGCVLSIVENLKDFSVPVITGLDLVEIPKIGQAIETKDKLQKAKLLEFLKAFKVNDLNEQVSELNLEDLQEINLYVRGGLEIKTGEGKNIVKKLALLQPILEDVWKNHRSNGFIDMRFDGDPIFRKNNNE